MDQSVYKDELRKIRLKQRQLSTKLKSFTSQDVSLLDSSMVENQWKSMEAACFDVTDIIDEMIMALEESDGHNEEMIYDLDSKKEKVLTALNDSKQEFMLKRNKTISSTDNQDVTKKKKNEGALKS